MSEERTIHDRYEELKRKGYFIDSRLGFSLTHNVYTHFGRFHSMEAAVTFAEQREEAKNR